MAKANAERHPEGHPGGEQISKATSPNSTPANTDALLIDNALACAARGWPVYPLNIGHDESKCDGGTANCKTSDFNGSWKNSTTNPEKIKKWSGYNAYLIDCEAAGIVVADEDPGDTWPFNGTMVVASGRGQHHYYEDILGLKNAQGLQPWGVDVRGVGGLIYGPGSYHPHGGYRVVNDVPLALPPAELVQALQRRDRASENLDAGAADGTPYAELDEDHRAAVDEAVEAKITYWQEWFAKAIDWPEHHHPYTSGGETGGWELLSRNFTWSMACLAAAPWSPVDAAQARDLYELVPEDIREDPKCAEKFSGVPVAKVKRQVKEHKVDLSFRALVRQLDVADVFGVIEDEPEVKPSSDPQCQWVYGSGNRCTNTCWYSMNTDWWPYCERHQKQSNEENATPEKRHSDKVELALESLRVRHEARRLFLAEQRGERAKPVAPVSLGDLLDEPDEDTPWLVTDLWPKNGRVVFAAQHKAGKTTGVMNLAKCLADGGQFLDRFDVEPAERVVLIDNEMPRHKVRQWLKDMAIANTAAIEVVSLRGAIASFDLTDPEVRSEWASTIGAADVLVFDCLRPVLDALGMSEDKDAGRFLTLLSEMCGEAGIGSLMVVHHMGHNGERARGDSAILGWPDANWTLTRETEDQASDRFFSAYGRDVDVSEGRLSHDAESRLLSWAGGSRSSAKKSRAEAVAGFRDSELREQILEVFKEAKGDGLSKNDVYKVVEANKTRLIRAIDALGEDGFLELRGTKWYLASTT